MISKVNKQVYYRLLDFGMSIEPAYSTGKKVDMMLEQWAAAKKDIYEAFGNKLKVSTNIETTADKESYEDSLAFFLESLKSEREFLLVHDICESYLSRYSENSEYVVNNIIMGTSITIGEKIFKSGTKISKFLASFTPTKLRDRFNILYSQFLQSLQTTGELVLSIDPCDYLTMSINKNGWSSCHRLHGGYSAGTLSYMLDKCSVVCYLTSSKDCYYSEMNIKWNNKKWRQMIYLNPINKYFVQSRHYPNSNMGNSKAAAELLSSTLGIENPITSYEHRVIENFITDYDYDEPLHYNDIIANWSMDLKACVTYPEGLDISNTDSVIVGASVQCLNDDCDCMLDNTEHLVCYCCSDEYCDDDDDYYDEE